MHSEADYIRIRTVSLTAKAKQDKYLELSKSFRFPTVVSTVLAVVYGALTFSRQGFDPTGLILFSALTLIGLTLSWVYFELSNKHSRKYTAAVNYINEHKYFFNNINKEK